MSTVDPSAGARAGRRGWAAVRLSNRLALLFVGVSLLAVGLAVSLVLTVGMRASNDLVEGRHDAVIANLQRFGERIWVAEGPGWQPTQWQPALDLTAGSGNDVAVLDAGGALVAVGPHDPRNDPSARHVPVTVDGTEVGQLVVRFSNTGVAAAAGRLSTSLEVSAFAAAALAALLALAVAWSVSRRLTAPLLRMTRSVDAMRRGDRTARVGDVSPAPRELRELAGQFDAMADAAAEQENLRRGLVAEVAHELRTPVAVLQASVEALVDGVREAGPEELASLQEEVLRLAGRVADLQSLAGADAAALSLSCRPCDLAEIAASAVRQLDRAAYRTRVVTTLSPTPVTADPDRMHQVVTNLLSNAAKFSPPETAIRVRVWHAEHGAHLEVSDDGRGIAAEDLPHVFERFRRGGDSTGLPGSGIGLTIVRQLVQAHQGEVSISSAPGRGTTVTVQLPTRPGVGAAGRNRRGRGRTR